MSLRYLTVVFLLCISTFVQAQVTPSASPPNSANTNPVTVNTPNNVAATTSTPTAGERAQLQKELNNLLKEKNNLSQLQLEMIQSENEKQVWLMVFAGILCAVLVVAFFLFWRFHTSYQFQIGLSDISHSLMRFHNSLLNGLDNTSLKKATTIAGQYANNTANANTSTSGNTDSTQKTGSSHVTEADLHIHSLAPNTTSPSTIGHNTINPNTLNPSQLSSNTIGGRRSQEDLHDMKGKVDSWISSYEPPVSPLAQIAQAKTEIEKPKSPMPWIEMTEKYRQENNPSLYNSVRKEIKRLFNIRIHSWEEQPAQEATSMRKIQDYPHILSNILEFWPTNSIQSYLDKLLNNSRLGARQGFDLPLYQQLEKLANLANDPSRPRDLMSLKNNSIGAFLFEPKFDDGNVIYPNKSSQNSPTPSLHNALHQTTISNLDTETIQEPALDSQFPNTVYEEADTKNKIDIPLNFEENIAPKFVYNPQNIDIPLDYSEQEKIPQLPPNDGSDIDAENEVRIKLAEAYVELGDKEGACILLDDVINSSQNEDKEKAQRMLKEIQASMKK